MTALLIVAAITDLLLAGLLIIASGFVFDSGPEGMAGAPPLVATWAILLLGCFAAPVLGFVQRRVGKTGTGVLIALLPPVATAAVAASGVYLF